MKVVYLLILVALVLTLANCGSEKGTNIAAEMDELKRDIYRYSKGNFTMIVTQRQIDRYNELIDLFEAKLDPNDSSDAAIMDDLVSYKIIESVFCGDATVKNVVDLIDMILPIIEEHEIAEELGRVLKDYQK